MTRLDLSDIPHEWERGTVVIIIFPRRGEPLCVTLPVEQSADAQRTFQGVQEELKPEVMVMFQADGMPDGSHAPLAVFPDPQPLRS
jgi:hypothetical protein